MQLNSIRNLQVIALYDLTELHITGGILLIVAPIDKIDQSPTLISLKLPLKLLAIIVVILVKNLLIIENTPLENGSGDLNLLIIKDLKTLRYPKETNFLVLQDQSKKTYRKGMWALDSGCSRHKCGKKENFKTIKRLDGGFVDSKIMQKEK